MEYNSKCYPFQETGNNGKIQCQNAIVYWNFRSQNLIGNRSNPMTCNSVLCHTLLCKQRYTYL